jgi:hypothetical protein
MLLRDSQTRVGRSPRGGGVGYIEERSVDLSFKRKLAFGATALAAAAFAGGAYAATQESATNARQAFLNDVAKRLNVQPQQLTAAMNAALDDQLKAAVAAGKLTQAQADAIKQRSKRDGVGPLGEGFLVPQLHGGERFFFKGAAPPLAGPMIGGLGAVTKYLGLTPAALRDQLAAGKSLAEVAQARGKSVTGLKEAIIGSLRLRLDRAVAAKELTSGQEQLILSKLSARLDAVIARPGLELPFEGHPGSMPGLGPGRAFHFRMDHGDPGPGAGVPSPPGPLPPATPGALPTEPPPPVSF